MSEQNESPEVVPSAPTGFDSSSAESSNPFAAAQAEIQSAIQEKNVSADALNDAYSSDVDVPPSSAWDNINPDVKEEQPEVSAEPAAAEEAEETPVVDVSDEQTISFKANGIEQNISLEEARKKLAMAEGGAQAFTKLAKATKEMKALEARLAAAQAKAESMDKLEELKNDPEAIIKIATGQDPEEFLASYLKKRRILETGSDAEKADLERAERLAQLEREVAENKAERERLKAQEEERNFNSERNSLKSMLEGEFFKHKVDHGNEVASNEANELLWQMGQREMTRYVKKYKDHTKFKELLPKMVEKSFSSAASKLNRLATGSVQEKVDEAIKQKKQDASEKAAVASTPRSGKIDPSSFKGVSNIFELANKAVGKKIF